MAGKPTFEALEKRVRELERGILEHEQVDALLRESEERYRILFENAPLGYQSLDANGNLIECNETWCTTLGYTRKEVLGRNFSEFIHPDFLEVFKENFPKFKSAGYILGVEFEMIRKDGSEIVVSFNGRIGREKDGSFRQTHCVFQDITDRKRVEEALRESEEKLTNVLHHSNEVFYIHDTEHQLNYVSPQCLDILGYTPEEMMVKWTTLVTENPINKKGFDFTEKAIRTGEKQPSYMLEIQRKDGETRLVEIEESPIKDKTGRVVAITGALRDITESKLAEETLREREENLSNFFNTSTDFLWVLDDAGNILKVNETVKRRLGYDGDDLIGKPVLTVHPPERREEAGRIVVEMLKRERDSYPIPLMAKDGTQIPVETRIVDGIWDGKRAIFGRSKDISELKQAEEEMQKLALAIKHSSELVNLASLDGRMTFLNDAGGRMLGIDPEKVKDTNIMEVIPGHLAGLVEEGLLPALKGGGTWEGDLQYRNLKTGKLTDVHTIAFTVNDPDTGKPQFLANVSLDITERKRTEDALRESEEKFRFLAEKMADIVWTVDLDFRTTYVSPSVEKVLGYTPEERKRQSLEEMITPKSLHRVQARYLEEFQREQAPVTDPDRSLIVEVEYYRKDGSTVWMENTVKSLRDPAGAMVGIYGVSRDISGRKRAEEEKEKLRAQLLQAQKMESIGTMAGGIAHDFNNILAIILGNTEMAIKDVPEWNQGRQNLEEVIKASLRARDMVRQILAFSRQTKVEQKPMRIRPIVEDSLRLIRSTAPTTIEIREDYSVRSDTVLGDPTQISQVLVNLCTNATHAMREKGGVLDISLRNTEFDQDTAALHQDLPSDKYVALTVSDSGHGMEPEIAERIFDPYFTTKGVGEGSGMGLSVVHGIIKDHGGVVRVESEPGKGSSFEVFLPVLVRDVEPSSEPFATLPTGSEHILFVDDEQALADLGKRMLQHLGYQVTVRTSSIEALEAFKAQPDKYDLLVTDMTMPNMTGKDLSRELLRIRPGFPIILCTGFSEMITEDSAKQMGIKAFVMKPLVLREIAETVRRTLD